MTRGRKMLSPEQQTRLKDVADADDAWRKAKKYEYEKARAEAERKIAAYAITRDKAISAAVQAGVPKVIVGRDGLGTTNPHAVNEAVRRVAEVQAETGVPIPVPSKPRFAWGEIVGKDERWVYGWVLDDLNPDVVTSSGIGSNGYHAGFFVAVDRQNEVVTTMYAPGRVLTTADTGWEDLRAWAAAHVDEA